MRSKQVNFFLMPEDIGAIEKYLKNRGDVVLLAEPTHKSELRIIDSLLVQPDREKEEWVAISLAQKDHLDRVYLKFIEEQNYWIIDNWRSEVIEFSGCLLEDNVLHRGRVYTKTGYYNDEGEWEERNPEFIKWVDSIFRWLKKTFPKKPIAEFRESYNSPAAQEWVKQGGQLSQL